MIILLMGVAGRGKIAKSSRILERPNLVLAGQVFDIAQRTTASWRREQGEGRRSHSAVCFLLLSPFSGLKRSLVSLSA
jgi:hypothetical protein